MIVAHDRRRILHVNVTISSGAHWTARRVVEAFPYDARPRFLLHDRDKIFADFGELSMGAGTRTPREIFSHIGDLLEWALSQARGQEHRSGAMPGIWDDEVGRFFDGLGALDAYLVSGEPLGQEAARVFQSAVADALTHVGQIAFLRRLGGSPLRGENYNRADIRSGRVGPEQTAARREFD